jgi:hypothetical protein
MVRARPSLARAADLAASGEPPPDGAAAASGARATSGKTANASGSAVSGEPLPSSGRADSDNAAVGINSATASPVHPPALLPFGAQADAAPVPEPNDHNPQAASAVVEPSLAPAHKAERESQLLPVSGADLTNTPQTGAAGHAPTAADLTGQGTGHQPGTAAAPAGMPAGSLEPPVGWLSQEEEEVQCQTILLEEVAGTLEAALQQPGKIVAFPRYELRHIPLVGPEAFFLRLAFLQMCFLNTPAGGRTQPFETSVESLMRWANVGRATLHRFKKGEASRGLQPAAGWFGIEQLPSAPRSGSLQQQPPCRYRLRQEIPLTPMDADHLHALLLEAGIQQEPLSALKSLCLRPVQEILPFPPPAPSESQRRRAPEFLSVAGVVHSALGSRKIEPELRPEFQEWVNRLNEHVTMPHQIVHVSWYFLREWLPLLGHDAAALVLYARAQGYYNPQTQELRDAVTIHGGYRELAQVIGLKRDRTIGDWLPNLFERASGAENSGRAGSSRSGESEKWQRAQQRQTQTQEKIGRFVQVLPGSRKKMPEGHYAFSLRVQIKGEPLTPRHHAARKWVYATLAACAEQDVLGHFYAWVTSPALAERARAQNDGPGTLGAIILNDGPGILGADAAGASSLGQPYNDGWGILAAREMTAGESGGLDEDGWGILASILNDGAGILAAVEMTAGELFKILVALNTSWEPILQKLSTTAAPPKEKEVVVEKWDLQVLCQRNGGMSGYRKQILAREKGAEALVSWILYAYSFKGRGVTDPLGWAFARLNETPSQPAEGVFARLAKRPPAELARLLREQLVAGTPPRDEDWQLAFQDAPAPRLRALAETLGLIG